MKVLNDFVKTLSIFILESIFCGPSWIAKEILRMYNAIIQNVDSTVTYEVVQEIGSYYL